MTTRRILTFVLTAFVLAEARWHHSKRAASTSICDPFYENPSKLLCYCMKDIKQINSIRSAECFLTTGDIQPSDLVWNLFETIKSVTKLTLTNTRGISFKYIPTSGLKHIESIVELVIKYGNIEKVHPYSFPNASSLTDISLLDSQIQILEPYAFAHHKDLKEINLDKNNIIEINRDVFIDLPSLEKLFLTSNHITTIHDRAFIHLLNLKELEINMNKIFSLNSETFSGLNKLQKLDLSNNILEVIGDNTFLPLKKLLSLNLEGNKIQMLDGKAFHGLVKLEYLSLAHNNLSNLDNEQIFDSLPSLKTLNLKANSMRELKASVLAPLLDNFYEVGSHLDIEDNEFTCDCHLDWLIHLMNHTRSKSLQMTLENLKCIPNAKLKELWAQLEETERSSGQVFDNDENQGQTDYEYYDDTQLNGKLFYTDVRDIINCTKATKPVSSVTKAVRPTSPPATKPTTAPRPSTLAIPSTPKATPGPSIKKPKEPIVNQGLLDLSAYDTTPKQEIKENEIEKIDERKPNAYTTTRLATVSAKPIEKKNLYENMASDEAKPDKLKAQRSIEEENNDLTNNGHKHVGYVALVSIFCFFRLFH